MYALLLPQAPSSFPKKPFPVLFVLEEIFFTHRFLSICADPCLTNGIILLTLFCVLMLPYT